MGPHTRILRYRNQKGMTLVETIFALLLLAMTLLGFIAGFIQSRRTTEASVLHAAASSLVYGLIEQMKMIDYTSALPNTATSVVVRLNQDTDVTLSVVYTQSPNTPQGPNSTPSTSATAGSVGAIDNILGSIPLSTVSAYSSQPLNLNLWIWIDEIPDPAKDVSQVKKVTVVYTYTLNDGRTVRTVRDREVFLRTLYNR